jgi:putative oxidoreductase
VLQLATKLRNLILRIAGALGWLPPTLARLCVGWVFFQSGWGKLHNLPQVTEYFQSLGLPAPAFQAALASTTELVCGGLLLVGLLTRIASVPLIITMTVAILTAKKEELTGFSALYGFIEYLYILLMVYLGVQGPGPLSLDQLLVKRFVKPAEEPGTATAAAKRIA